MNHEQQRRFKELLVQASEIMSGAWLKLTNTQEFIEFQEILDSIERECGQKITRLGLNISLGERIDNIIFAKKPSAGSSQRDAGDEAPESVGLTTIIPEDQEILGKLKIQFNPKDQAEIREILKEDGFFDGSIMETNASQKLLTGQVSETEEDPRTVGQIINRLRDAARKLDLKSRQTVAKTINMDLGLHLSTSDQLANDTFWLQQIQTAINRIRELAGAPDKFKSLLVSLEIIIKSGGVES